MPARHIVLLLLSLILAGCSPARIANLATPRGGFEVRRDIAYGAEPRQALDLYLPDETRPGAPLVVFFYGGDWSSGAKGDYLFLAQALTAQGHPVAVPDYRLYPQVRFPAFVEDGAEAVARARDALARIEGRRRPVVLMGHSAGAQIAALLALDDRHLREAGLRACEAVAGMIGLAGPYDFLPLEEERYRRIFPEASRAASQPIAFVDASDPPLLLIAGTADETVDPGNSRRLAARVEESGGSAEAVFYEGVGHIEIIAAFAPPLRSTTPALRDVRGFLGRLSGVDPGRCG